MASPAAWFRPKGKQQHNNQRSTLSATAKLGATLATILVLVGLVFLVLNNNSDGASLPGSGGSSGRSGLRIPGPRRRTAMRDNPAIPSVHYFDLAAYEGTAHGATRGERVLYLVPLRDAVPHMAMFFGHMENLTYPHTLIDLAFLVSDSKDGTLEVLTQYLEALQRNPDPSKRFGTIEIFEKDFGQAIGQGFSDRHGFAAQGPRRKLMARARNWLLSVALQPDHSWVYWRDADVQTVPPTILEDLMAHNKDVIVPNVWRPLPDWLGNEQPYDLNSWQESETGLQLAEQLDEDACIVEGYPEYATWRPHLAYLRDPYGDPTVEMELDGIGGVSILAKASVFRQGAHFPAFSFQKHAETEGFGKMCRRMGLSVIGLPHYVIWHIYEPSSDDIKHMEWMADEEERREIERQQKEVFERTWKAAFKDVREDWQAEKLSILKNSEVGSFRRAEGAALKRRKYDYEIEHKESKKK